MIRAPHNLDSLRAADRFALAVLVDLSRLLPAEPDVADAVRLEIVDVEPPSTDLRAFVAHGWFLEPADGVVRVPRATLRQIVDLAGAAAEQRATDRDRHGRIPSACNPAVHARLERTPIVSAAGVALRLAVEAAAGRRLVRTLAPWPEGKRWAVALTHDLDVVEVWPAFTALRLAELLRKAKVGLAARVTGAALRTVGRDPVWRAARDLLAREETKGIRSTWFVLCGTPSFATMRAGDLTYHPEGPKATRILGAVAAGGHEIALHGSFETGDRPEAFREQRSRLERMVQGAIAGVRQHYVRIVPGETQRGMIAGGFEYDSTFGFPDRNGFRLGVADVVPCWNATEGVPAALEHVPFMWMDRAQSKYQGIEAPQAWIDDAVVLAEESRSVEGAWIGLWHPNLTAPLGFPAAPEAYGRLLERLLAQDPWTATLGALVAWRRWRRSVRATAMDAAGRVEVRMEGTSPYPLVIEDTQRRAVQVVPPAAAGGAP